MRLVKAIAATALAFVCAASSALALDATRSGGGAAGLLPLRAVVSAPGGAADLCAKYSWACAAGTSAASFGADQMEMAVRINRAANARIRPVADLVQYHAAENWAMPTARGGDCEDYALYKKAKLIEAGVSPDRLLLATVLDRKGDSHAVLVLRTDTADLVLDNLRGAVKPWDETGYTFLRMQDPRNPARWVATMAGGMLPGVSS
ncbi:transglutaminase-like cysteine peptidase [Paragemmobacter aquarius]|nr:transglutaminase-like cysteine peptidase [Gemmobacter aquarius]